MRKIVVHEFITLDGAIQAPGAPGEDTKVGFVRGGWTLPCWRDDIPAHLWQTTQQISTVDAAGLGCSNAGL